MGASSTPVPAVSKKRSSPRGVRHPDDPTRAMDGPLIGNVAPKGGGTCQDTALQKKPLGRVDGYLVLIILGLFLPLAAVFGYLGVALYLVVPFQL